MIGSQHLKTGKNVGRQKVWAFVLEDYAELFGMSVEATRKAMLRGRFDPGDLRSVLDFVLHRSPEPEPAELPPPESTTKLLPR